jgi:hypothetical protein
MPDTFLDSVEDRLLQLGGASGVVGFEKLRRALQQGMVSGAAGRLAAAKVFAKHVPPINAALELGQMGDLIMNPEKRKGHAEAGKELTKKPLLYQIGKAYLTPADSASKYGAYKEELDKKAFEKYLEEEYPWADEWAKKQNAEIAARRAKESGTAAR